MTTTEARAFADTTAVTKTSGGHFTAELDPSWTVVGKPNGGYLQAIAGRAAATAAAHPHVVAASTHFLHSPDPGAVDIAVEVIREGRSLSQVRSRMSQGGQPRLEAIFTLGDLEPVEQPDWLSPAHPPRNVPPQDCRRFQAPAELFSVALLQQVDLRLEPDSRSSLLERPRGVGELRGWLTLPGAVTFDPISLLFAVDVLPPATFDIQFTGWVPTLELTTYIRALPAPGPVEIVHRANVIQGRLVDETCTVRDATGRVVAQSTQLASIRFP